MAQGVVEMNTGNIGNTYPTGRIPLLLSYPSISMT